MCGKFQMLFEHVFDIGSMSNMSSEWHPIITEQPEIELSLLLAARRALVPTKVTASHFSLHYLVLSSISIDPFLAITSSPKKFDNFLSNRFSNILPLSF
jgi:hypothetical protein